MKDKEPDKTGRKRKSQQKELRDKTVIAMAMEGKSGTEIADAVGLTRQRVSVILNSVETKAIIREAESRITRMVEKALDVVDRALDSFDLDTALKGALPVLKTKGLFKEKVDLQHSFPKPTIVEKSDGTTVVLGASDHDDEE